MHSWHAFKANSPISHKFWAARGHAFRLLVPFTAVLGFLSLHRAASPDGGQADHYLCEGRTLARHKSLIQPHIKNKKLKTTTKKLSLWKKEKVACWLFDLWLITQITSSSQATLTSSRLTHLMQTVVISMSLGDYFSQWFSSLSSTSVRPFPQF